MGLDVAAEWSPARRQRAADQLAVLGKRQRIVAASSHPAELALSCDPDYVITPAVELMSRNIETVLRSRRKRLMITAPPQEGKSRLCAVWTPLRALQLHPNWRIMLLTYADGLAEEHSRTARDFIAEFGSNVTDSLTGAALPDRLGFSLSPTVSSASNWRIAEGRGGLVAAGRDATITGKQANLLIVDDPFKGMVEADSATTREKVEIWYHAVASTRLAPGASVIFINTRWHPEDLSGTLLKHDRELPPEQREWRYLNIPAVSHAGIPDALGRPPGVVLDSALGRTREDFAATERAVGKRVWNALYQGSPKPPEGGLFSQAWFDTHRVETMPDRTKVRIVAVDPSESGEGDEAGIIAAALTGDDRCIFTHDRSFQATSDQWAEAAVELAYDTEASDIFIETYTAGTTYVAVVKAKIAALAAATTIQYRRQRLEFLWHRVHGWRGTGDSVARSGLLRQAIEVGTAAVLGQEMAELEAQATLWQTGQHQPDRVAAAVIAHDRILAMVGRVAMIGAPNRTAESGRNPWLNRKVG